MNANAEKKTVLIIDDDTRNIFALSSVLKSKGFPTMVAQSAAEGFEKMRSLPKDSVVVLLDMMMPEMDGYETIKVIRQGPFAEIPVIAVTAQAMAGDRERCLEAGADDYISKPIDVDKLLTFLQR